MTDEETARDDARREQAELDELDKPAPCSCGGVWRYIGCDPAYGADADGNRGVKLTEWECDGCGDLVSMLV